MSLKKLIGLGDVRQDPLTSVTNDRAGEVRSSDEPANVPIGESPPVGRPSREAVERTLDSFLLAIESAPDSVTLRKPATYARLSQAARDLERFSENDLSQLPDEQRIQISHRLSVALPKMAESLAPEAREPGPALKALEAVVNAIVSRLSTIPLFTPAVLEAVEARPDSNDAMLDTLRTLAGAQIVRPASVVARLSHRIRQGDGEHEARDLFDAHLVEKMANLLLARFRSEGLPPIGEIENLITSASPTTSASAHWAQQQRCDRTLLRVFLALEQNRDPSDPPLPSGLARRVFVRRHAAHPDDLLVLLASKSLSLGERSDLATELAERLASKTFCFIERSEKKLKRRSRRSSNRHQINIRIIPLNKEDQRLETLRQALEHEQIPDELKATIRARVRDTLSNAKHAIDQLQSSHVSGSVDYGRPEWIESAQRETDRSVEAVTALLEDIKS